VLDREHRRLTLGVLLSITVVAFNAMGVVTILPAVARDLGGLSTYGWSVSAFMLASIAGTVVAGVAADRRGLVTPYASGLALFAAGSVLAASAGDWAVLLAARALQGAGNGLLVAVAYVAIARGYAGALHARMLALLSSAWIVPSIVGPALAGTIADTLSWRVAFLALLPVLALAAALATAGLRRVAAAPAGSATGSAATLGAALALVAGTALFLAALDLADHTPVAAGALAVAGATVALASVRRLLPAGTLRGRAGLPSAVAVRGLLAAAFLGMEAFVPLGLTTLRGLSAAQAGLVMTAGSLSWSAAAFTAARLDERDRAARRGRRLRISMLLLAAGVAVAALGILDHDLPVAVAALGWCIAGGGIGASYSTVAAAAFARTPDGAEGRVSAALQLSETLSVSVTAGTLGALVGAGVTGGRPSELALAITFGAGTAVALAAASLARRAAEPARE
jgi:MFS family permease